MIRSALFLAVLLAFAACDNQPDTAERILGSWKNGDGNLIRFEEGGSSAIGQEGLGGEGRCTWTVRGDSVIVTTVAEGPGDPVVTYDMHLRGDTLYFAAITRDLGGERQRLDIDDFAQRAGKPLYKLHFTRITETP